MKNAHRLTGISLAVLLLAGGCSTLEKGDAEVAEKDKPQFGPAPSVAASPAGPILSTAANAPAAGVSAKVFPGTGVLVKQAPVQPDAASPEDIVLNFEGVDIRTVIETILSQYLREPYLVHPTINGTITLRTTRGIAKKDLIPTLEMLLRQNGAALVREDGLYKIMPLAMVRGSVTPQLGGAATPLPPGYSVIVVPLKYIGAKAMKDILDPFVPDGSAVKADEIRNLVVLAGGQRELKHLLDTVDMFDVDFLSGMSVGLFPLKSTDVKGLTADIDKIFGAQGNPLAGVVRIIPIERLNSLLIVTPQPRYLEEAKKWIERLDQAGGTGGGTSLHVYQVKNGKAENLASLLSEIFGKSSSTTTTPQLAPGARPAEIRTSPYPTPGQANPTATTTTTTSNAPTGPSSFSGDGSLVSKDVRVIADKDNNALLILASPGDYDKIEAALNRLDILRRQVLVEVTIAEVQLTGQLQFGIDWFINSRSGLSNGQPNITRGTSNFGGSLPIGSAVPSTTTTPTATQYGLSPTGTVLPFSGLQLINTLNGDVRAVLRALELDNRATLLSSPKILALDNEKAEIKVGDRISIQTGSQTTGTTTGTIVSEQYIDTGVLLTVTPRINAGGQVTMEISQEVSEAKATTSGTSGNPDISTRNFKTSVTVGSGDTMTLAGLIRKKNGFSNSGLPLLSKIPVIGAVFGSQNTAEERTELVIVITPRVITTTAQAKEANDEMRRKLPLLEGLLQKSEKDKKSP